MTEYPLDGIRVVNFGISVIGPMTGRYLSEYGAEVIRVESKGRPDQIRFTSILKPGLSFDDMMESGGTFINYNRSVKCIQANLKNPKSVDLIRKLIAISDVVNENYSPGTMDGLGLGYEELKKVNPKIIMLSESAVGQNGPWHDLMTYGPTIASLCGEQSMLGYQDGEPAQDYAVADFNGACMGAFLILAALRFRQRTGKGQYIDLGQAATMLHLLGEPMMDYSMNKRIAGMHGNWRTGFVPYNNYRCKPDQLSPYPPSDQWVSIAVKTEEEWRGLCNSMGNPAWTKDRKFNNRAKRWQNQDELDQRISEWTINYTTYEVTDMLQKAGVAAMVVMDNAVRAEDPQVKARDAVRLLDTAIVKRFPMESEGMRFSRSKAKWGAGSRLGEDNNYVYGDLLGLSKEEIAKLIEEKAIF